MSTFNDIARYAEGEMSADEQLAFEAALLADGSLRQQLALYQEVHGSLQQHFSADVQRSQLKDTLQAMRGEFFGTATQPARIIRMKRYLRSVMAVAAILIAVIVIWQPWKPDLFNKFAETSMAAPAERGDAADNLLQEAVEAFNKKEYGKAATLLRQIKQQDTANSSVNFYYGVALLQTGKLKEAREIFNQLFAGQSAFKFEAAFYQALEYLKEGNKAACREWLQKIPSDAANYNKAQTLLQKL